MHQEETPRHRFPKKEHLKSRKKIQALFKNKQTKGTYPLRVFWTIHEDVEGLAQAAFAVPKRKFRKASKRNPIRRKVKESYRLHKHDLLQTLAERQKGMSLMWLYVAKEAQPYDLIEKSTKKLLNHLIQVIEDEENN